MGRGQGNRKAGRRRRWRGWWWKWPLLLAAFSVVQVLVLRFVDPPFSAYMVARQQRFELARGHERGERWIDEAQRQHLGHAEPCQQHR